MDSSILPSLALLAAAIALTGASAPPQNPAVASDPKSPRTPPNAHANSPIALHEAAGLTPTGERSPPKKQ